MTTTLVEKPEIQTATTLVKHKVGRPKIYTDEVLNELAEDFEEYMEDESHFWFKDWAILNRIECQRLSEWGRSHKRFAEAYARAVDLQESRLAKMGLKDRSAGRIVELILKSRHGFTDRVENTDKAPENAIPSDPKVIQEQIKVLQAALSAQEQLKVDLGTAGSAVCDG